MAQQMGLDSGDRILELPMLDIIVEAIAGRVICRGVGPHPIGIGLDQGRPIALTSPLQSGLGDGVRRQDDIFMKCANMAGFIS